MMRQFQRFATLWLMCLLAGLAKAQDVTATWDFNGCIIIIHRVRHHFE